jgi:hypothetical protein
MYPNHNPDPHHDEKLLQQSQKFIAICSSIEPHAAIYVYYKCPHLAWHAFPSHQGKCRHVHVLMEYTLVENKQVTTHAGSHGRLCVQPHSMLSWLQLDSTRLPKKP